MKTLGALVLGLALLSATACTKKQLPAPAADKPLAAAGTPAPAPVTDDSAVRNGIPLGSEASPATLQTAYFDFNASTLKDQARSALTADAGILAANPGVSFRVEGNCDERGSTQYNIALGERRGNAARDFLVSLGVPASRLTVVSYGKEKPVDSGHTDAAWAKNRRVELITSSATKLVSTAE